MSGPEWTPEPGGPDLAGQPLTGDHAAPTTNAASNPTIRVGSNPFGPGPSRPEATEQDDSEAQANLEADTAGPSKLAALIGSARTAVVGLVVGFWNRRRRSRAEATEPEPEPAADPAFPLDPGVASDPASGAESPPASSGGRGWSPAGWSWETRVGVAAVFSFLILVGVFVVKKGWLGEWKRVPLAVEQPNKPKNDEKPGKPESSGESPPLPTTAENARTAPIAGASPGTSPPPPVVAPTTPLQIVDGTTPEPGPQHVPPPSSGSTALTLPPETPTQQNPTTLPGSPVVATPEVALSDTGGGPPAMPNLPPGIDLATTPPANPPEMPPATPVADPTPPPSTPVPVPVAAETKPNLQPTPDPKEALPPVEPAVVAAPSAPDPAPVVAADPPKVDPPAAPPEPAAVAGPTTAQPTNPPVLEPVPTATASQPADTTTSTRGDNWVVMSSGGKRPSGTTSSDIGSNDSMSNDAAPARGRSRVADGPPVRDDPAQSAGPAGLVLHTVQPGENFWTISQQYYNSHRYYRALHKANIGQVPEIGELYVGTVLRIPPPETLDRSLVTAPVIGAAIDGAAVSRASSAGKSGDDPNPGVEIPPTRSTRPGYRRIRAQPTQPTEAPNRPSYQVKANDTLRSIARDTLSDSHRATEIYNLNRDLLTDPKSPIPAGTTLTLPEDAVVGRRVR